MSTIEKYNINTNNCNGILKRLYQSRDKIGTMIDKYIVMGRNTKDIESEYIKICNDISDICNWRSSHPGCLLEGDLGYSEF